MGYQKALEKYIAATNTHDFKNVKAIIAPDAVYWFTNKTCTNTADIQAFFEQTWEMIQDEVYKASDVNWLAVDHDAAACTYTYHWEGFYKGEFKKGSGRATNVFKRIEGEWKLVHEHLSAMPTNFK